MKNTATRYYSASRVEMTRFVPQEYSKVLEIGCGRGNFAKNLCNSKSEVWGVEPNKDAATEAGTKIDRVLVGTFSDVNDSIPNDYFDLIVCNDVIEHMIDHDKFFEEIKSKLTGTGVLIGSVPNILHITSLFKIIIQRDWPYKDEGILDRTHLRFFTSRSLKKCLSEHNYTLTDYAGVNSIVTKGTHLRGANPLIDKAVRAATALFIVATFGYYFDSQYPQLAFAVKKANRVAGDV